MLTSGWKNMFNFSSFKRGFVQEVQEDINISQMHPHLLDVILELFPCFMGCVDGYYVVFEAVCPFLPPVF